MPRLFEIRRSPRSDDLPPLSGGGVQRDRALHRLQIGVAGVVMMILLVGLASIIQNRANQTDATTVPEAASTTEPKAPPPQSDPLVEAGVVPDLPEPSPTPTQSAPILPEAGATPRGEN